MSDPKLGRRYAQALYNAAKGEGVVDQVVEAMADVMPALLDDRTFQIWWRSSRIPLPDKMAGVDKAFGNLPQVLRQFLKLLLEKKREAILGDVVNEFRLIADRESGVVRATLTTAIELTEQELEPFRVMLADRVGGDAILTPEVDKALIGGFRLRYGDQVMDGSVARSLESLAMRMSVGA